MKREFEFNNSTCIEHHKRIDKELAKLETVVESNQMEINMKSKEIEKSQNRNKMFEKRAEEMKTAIQKLLSDHDDNLLRL